MEYDFLCLSNKRINQILSSGSLEKVLSSQEKEKYVRLTSIRRREEWLGGRYLTKWLSSKWLESHFEIKVLWHEIEICSNSDGAPYVRFNSETLRVPHNLHISISHNGDYVAAAVSDCPIGVDIEMRKKIREEVQSYFLNKSEILEFARYFGEEGAMICWTMKEAYLKALGKGFAISPKSFSIVLRGQKNIPEAIVIDSKKKKEYQIKYEALGEKLFASVAILD